MRRLVSILLVCLLVSCLFVLSMAFAVDATIENEGGVEILSVEEGELFELPQRDLNNETEPEIQLISMDFVGEESAEIDVAQNDGAAMVAENAEYWDWFAYKVRPKNGSSSDIFPLNQDVSFEFLFANMGNVTSPATTAKITVGPPNGNFPTSLLGSININPMASYDTSGNVYVYAVTFRLSGTPGACALGAEINPNHASEGGDSTNRVMGIYEFGVGGEIVDPACYDIIPSEDPFPVGKNTSVKFVVANYGNVTTQNVPVYIAFRHSAGGMASTNITTTAIPAGYALGYNVTALLPSAGEVEVSMELDLHHEVVDSNRNNNTLVETFETVGYQYGTLGFGYPLPAEYTGHYKYYAGHAGRGLDLNAPQGTPIYSVDNATVAVAGGSESDTRGYFVVTINDTSDPYNGEPLITRYLHMWTNPNVKSGAVIDQEDKVGEVGKWGFHTPGTDPVNHLHIDFNSVGITNQTVPEENGIEPKWFYPDVAFHLDTTPKSFTSSSDDCDFDLNELYRDGYYYDGALIDLIGVNEYEAWRERTDPKLRNVYKLIEDFGLTWEQLQATLYEPIYDAYISNIPK